MEDYERIIKVIEEKVLPQLDQDSELRAFYLKLIADSYKYIAEVA